MNTTDPANPVIPGVEVAAMFGITDRGAANRFVAKRGAELGAFKVNRQWFVPRSRLAAFIEAQSSTAPAAPSGRVRRTPRRQVRAA